TVGSCLCYTTVAAHPVIPSILPAATRRNTVIRPALGFVVDKTTHYPHPLLHNRKPVQIQQLGAAAAVQVWMILDCLAPDQNTASQQGFLPCSALSNVLNFAPS